MHANRVHVSQTLRHIYPKVILKTFSVEVMVSWQQAG